MEEKSEARTSSEGEILTLAQAAEYLNASLSTVLRLVNSGELRAFRIRKAWRTSSGACDEFVKRQFADQAVVCKSVDEG
ncbi:MAG: helix-turn-helix domain-containing protein [Coriobacteriaceae bacterium]|uniref:excisionase family DNA-binding protein n=1 Tax=Atopobium sp. oral taxon 416 TaxID=712157 RepID=UPI000FED3980|nr:excisionase family DNA-binding protein [Atopobium sp. oral taxon 416]QUC04021.1 excisionase family DNA-binding protein [Atopobium sp. oral taxon 416]RRF98537.1 MAG: helix-turn-helix domain-containing protein [Coriobacteriaceae bacterium]